MPHHSFGSLSFDCAPPASWPPSLNLAQTSQWLLSAIEQEKAQAGSILIVGCQDDFLLSINRQYLQHDYYTDIITFPYSDQPLSGELYISLERVWDNAQTLDQPPLRELLRVMIHGILHLLGYQDDSPDARSQMRTKEDYYLQQWEAERE